MKICFYIFIIFSIFSQEAFSKESVLESTIETTKNDLFIIGLSGIGGSLLGLSSLAFLDNQKNKATPVLLGAATGALIGLGFVTWSHVIAPKPYYSDTSDFNTELRRNWHGQMFSENLPETKLQIFSYNIFI